MSNNKGSVLKHDENMLMTIFIPTSYYGFIVINCKNNKGLVGF